MTVECGDMSTPEGAAIMNKWCDDVLAGIGKGAAMDVSLDPNLPPCGFRIEGHRLELGALAHCSMMSFVAGLRAQKEPRQ